MDANPNPLNRPPGLQALPEQNVPGPRDPGIPGLVARTPPGLQALRIEAFQIDSGIDPSSEDDDDFAPLPGKKDGEAVGEEKVQRLGSQTRKTFRDAKRSARVIAAIPGWLAWLDGRVASPERTIADAISSGSRAKIGAEVGYIRRTIENAIDAPKAHPTSASPSRSRPPGEPLAEIRAATRRREPADAMLEAQWQELSDYDRSRIEDAIPAVIRRNRWLFHARCLAEMDKRHVASPSLAMA